MPGSIFIIQNDDTLVEMTHQPYAIEDHPQYFLERYPGLHLAFETICRIKPERQELLKAVCLIWYLLSDRMQTGGPDLFFGKLIDKP